MINCKRAKWFMPTPEEKVRENIDRLLIQAGWAVRDQSEANIFSSSGRGDPKVYLISAPLT
jgi:hypothetical protein